MAETKRPKRERLLSPKGLAVYPRLTTPDTKFDPNGVYKTGLRMTVEEGAEFMADLDARLEAAYEQAVKDNKGKTFKIVGGKKTEIVKNTPYVLVLDEDGNETGDVDFSFSMKAQFKDKSDNLIPQKPTLVDGKGKEIKSKISVYGGSKIRVNYTPVSYDSNFGVGVKLYLNAVQIIKLVSGGANHGFGADEEAEYEYDEDNDTPSSGFDNEEEADGSADGDDEF